jgi:hypothetical protein
LVLPGLPQVPACATACESRAPRCTVVECNTLFRTFVFRSCSYLEPAGIRGTNVDILDSSNGGTGAVRRNDTSTADAGRGRSSILTSSLFLLSRSFFYSSPDRVHWVHRFTGVANHHPPKITCLRCSKGLVSDRSSPTRPSVASLGIDPPFQYIDTPIPLLPFWLKCGWVNS